MTVLCRLAAVALVWSIPAAALAADAGQVSGSFVLGETKLTPGHVVAVRVRDGNHPREDRTVVFLSQVAMDTASLTGQRDAYVLAINDPVLDGQNYLTVFITPKGEVSVNARVDDVQYVDSSGTIMGQPGSLKVDCPSNSVSAVDCRVWVEKPVEVEAGKAWSLDVKFAAPVIPKLSGQPLPADGGEAGRALLAFVEALKGDDLDAIFKLMTEAREGQHNADYNTPEENLASTKDIWSARLPAKLKITGGEQVSDELIYLEAEGELYPGLNMLFEIDMGRRDGRWAVDDGGSVGVLR